MQIDIGDHVHHAPTGEDWVVARVTANHVYPAGYPPCRAELSDCTLIRKASDTERQSMLKSCRRLPANDERYIA